MKILAGNLFYGNGRIPSESFAIGKDTLPRCRADVAAYLHRCGRRFVMRTSPVTTLSVITARRTPPDIHLRAVVARLTTAHQHRAATRLARLVQCALKGSSIIGFAVASRTQIAHIVNLTLCRRRYISCEQDDGGPYQKPWHDWHTSVFVSLAVRFGRAGSILAG
jgi:hypothetical protein